MVSQADFDLFVESQRGVRELALRDLRAWWGTVEHLSPSEIKAEAEGVVPLIARTYGEVSALAAADFYDAARAASTAKGRHVASFAPSGAASQAASGLGWATAPLFEGDPLAALDRAASVVDAAALQDGRDTIIHNSVRDRSRPRWARVTVGKTCAFCIMVASRGAVYRSAETAGRDFHAKCDCEPVPSWDYGKDLPPSYDEGGLYGLYDRARANADSGDPKTILAEIRRLDGGKHVTDGVGKYAAPRPSAARRRRAQQTP